MEAFRRFMYRFRRMFRWRHRHRYGKRTKLVQAKSQ